MKIATKQLRQRFVSDSRRKKRVERLPIIDERWEWWAWRCLALEEDIYESKKRWRVVFCVLCYYTSSSQQSTKQRWLCAEHRSATNDVLNKRLNRKKRMRTLNQENWLPSSKLRCLWSPVGFFFSRTQREDTTTTSLFFSFVQMKTRIVFEFASVVGKRNIKRCKKQKEFKQWRVTFSALAYQIRQPQRAANLLRLFVV